VRRRGGDAADVAHAWRTESAREEIPDIKDRPPATTPVWRDQRVLLIILFALLVILALDVYFTYFQGRTIGRGVVREIALGYEFALGEGFRRRAGERHFQLAQGLAEANMEERLWRLKRALQLDPDNLPANLAGARLLANLGRFEESLALAGRGLAQIDSLADRASGGQRNENLARLETEYLLVAYQVCRQLGGLEDAHHHLLRLIELAPGNERAELDLALVELDLGLATGARERLNDFITAHPESPLLPLAKAALARTYLQEGELNEAIRIGREGLDQAPDEYSLHLVLGETYFRQGDFELAARHLTRALPLAPDPIHCHYLLGEALLMLGEEEKAIPHFEAVIEAQPNSFEAHLGLGHAYLALGRTEQARSEYFIAAQIRPDSQQAREALDSIPRLGEEETREETEGKEDEN